jgi:hypothetical protein
MSHSAIASVRLIKNARVTSEMHDNTLADLHKCKSLPICNLITHIFISYSFIASRMRMKIRMHMQTREIAKRQSAKPASF